MRPRKPMYRVVMSSWRQTGEGAPSASTRGRPGQTSRAEGQGGGGLPAASSNHYLKVPRKSQSV